MGRRHCMEGDGSTSDVDDDAWLVGFAELLKVGNVLNACGELLEVWMESQTAGE